MWKIELDIEIEELNEDLLKKLYNCIEGLDGDVIRICVEDIGDGE